LTNIKLVLSYDGTDFSGSQRQKGRRTVQGVLEDGLGELLQTDVSLTMAGRTDAGVHALRQCANFRVERLRIPAARIAEVVNRRLPRDVRVIEADEVDESFSSRYDAKRRVYRYIVNTAEEDLYLSRYSLWLPGRLDNRVMDEAAKKMEGAHSFKAFTLAAADAHGFRCAVDLARVGRRGGIVTITVSANRFLYRMVVLVTAELIKVGRGTQSVSAFTDAVRGKATFAKKAAPSHGLTLIKVVY